VRFEPGAYPPVPRVRPFLFGSEDGGGLGARGCLPRGCCDEVRQDQGGGNGDDDRGERDGWLRQHAELRGEIAPRPPAARDAGGQPDEQRDARNCRGLPRDRIPTGVPQLSSVLIGESGV
jgi:hypothetical protein